MGADLYIQSIRDKAEKEHRPEFDAAVKKRSTFERGTPEADAAQVYVDAAFSKLFPEDGYFRDSYNATSVLRTWGLSWWVDVIPMLTDEGFLTVDGTRALLDRLRSRPRVFPTIEQIVEQFGRVDEKNTIEGWHEYFADKQRRLIQFLEHAIELNEPIRCSL